MHTRCIQAFGAVFLLAISLLAGIPAAAQVDFHTQPLATGLTIPWALQEAYDGSIWFSQRPGIVSWVHPDEGVVHNVLDITADIVSVSESGLLGLALDPNFETNGYVYIVTTGRRVDQDGESITKQVIRYTYRFTSLTEPDTIFRFSAGGYGHVGGRLIVLKDNTLLFGNGENVLGVLTYDWSNDLGKIIRMNLDGSVPDDNPMPGSYYISKGHRNPQGLLQLPNGVIVSSEHGQDIEDELNIIKPLANYGWPLVEGLCDTPEEIAYCDSAHVTEPWWHTGDHTLAPCGMAWYDHERYPALRGSILLCFLKASYLGQYKLSDDYTTIDNVRDWLPNRVGRLRDVLVTRSGRIFVCTGNRGILKAPLARPEYDGIYELTPVEAYTPPVMRMGSDTTFVKAVPGYDRLFYIDVCNQGETPAEARDSYPSVLGSPYANGGNPVTSIEPGMCAPRLYVFRPSEQGVFTNKLVMISGNGWGASYDTAIVSGSTNIGLLRPVKDTITITGMSDGVLTGILQLQNVGFDTVSVLSSGFTMDADIFTMDLSGITQPIQPGQIVDIPVSIKAGNPGEYKTKATFGTSSYLQPSVVVTADILVSSVWDVRESSSLLRVTPNPASQHVRISCDSRDITDIAIYDMLGNRVLQVQGSGERMYTLSLSGSSGAFVPGMYNVICTTPQGTLTSLLVISGT